MTKKNLAYYYDALETKDIDMEEADRSREEESLVNIT